MVIDKKSFECVYGDIITGSQVSDCPLPCTSTEITCVNLDEKFVAENNSRIDITFSDSVSFMMNDFPKFNFAVFLSTLGGSMGLWLGLGVLQSIDIMVNLVFRK